MKVKTFSAAVYIWLLLGLAACSGTETGTSEKRPGHSTPEEEGIPSRSILEFVEALEKAQPDAIHSFILRRNGNIVAEGWWRPYAPESPHMLYSLSKSFTSTAIGMAQDEGLLSVNDPVISFFPEEVPDEPGENLKAMRIRDLLRMNTGHQEGTLGRMRGSDNWVEAFLALEVPYKPGTHFLYNTGATYMCSAIIQKVTGMTLLEYLTPRLFEPLGIENPTWETDPRGINTGGYGLSITTEDISRFGQLLLQKGNWEGKQLVSEEWVEEATSYQTSNGSDPESDWEQGYGYQFWRCRYGIYRGDGAFGQFCIVMPLQNAVLAITSGSSDLQGILNVVWEHLLPAMGDDPLAADEEGLELLNDKLQGLAIKFPEGESGSPAASEITGRTYEIAAENPFGHSIAFDFTASPAVITIAINGGEVSFAAGSGSWEKGAMANPMTVSDKIAVSGAWEDPATYFVRMVYYETPFFMDFRFTFEGDRLIWDTGRNVSSGPGRADQFIGVAGS